MQEEAAAVLGEAQEALESGRWSAARDAFEAALEHEESAEALFGLGNALWWLGETESSVRYRERAYAAFLPAPRSGPGSADGGLPLLRLQRQPGQPRCRPRLAGQSRDPGQ
jgi:tetratricopeptide (TPR) repeat protein